MVLYGIRLIINVFDLFLYHRYLETFVGNRKTSDRVTATILIVCEIIGTAINQLDIGWLNIVTLAVVLFVYALQYGTQFMNRILVVLGYMGISVAIEPVGYIAYQMLKAKYEGREMLLYYTSMALVVFWRAVFMDLICRKREGYHIRLSILPKEVLYTLLSLPAMSLAACLMLVQISREIIVEQTFAVCICTVFLIFAMTYIVFYMMNKYTEILKSHHEEEMIREEAKCYKEYYEDMERYQDMVQDVKHDMKNRLMHLYSAARAGSSEQIMERVSELLGDIRLAEDVMYSANPVLNSILKMKSLRAKELGVDFSVNTMIPKKVSIDAGDMGVLYGNLLDNSLEACEAVEPGKRYIRLETKYQEGRLLIVIENSKAPGDNPGLHTSKADKRQHGRGIRTIRKLAEKYGGNLVLEDQGDKFVATMLLTKVEKIE